MKSRVSAIILGLVLAMGCFQAKAQYYQMANQVANLIRPALTGGLNYKGFVESGYTGFVGDKKAGMLDISTVQGFRYANWFFMGVGAGVDILFSQPDDNWGYGWADNPSYNNYYNHGDTKTAVMIPLFTDFRFNIGNSDGSTVSMFADLRLGGSFLIGNNYVRIGQGYLTKSECFYLRPSLGIRIPVSESNVKQAINIGIHYQLLTQNYWCAYGSSTTLNGVGASISFEW